MNKTLAQILLLATFFPSLLLHSSDSFAETRLTLTKQAQSQQYQSLVQPTVQSVVETKYKNKIAELNALLFDNQQAFKDSKVGLVNFVDESLLPLWSVTKTLKGLFGKTIWQQLNLSNKSQLVGGFNDTLQRYVQEGFEHYDGQQFNFVSVKLNKAQNRGYLTVELIPNLLPSFNVVFKITKNEADWYLYDVMVQGVSYISLKKDNYRNLYLKHELAGVLAFIKEKNKGFIGSQLKRI